MTDIFVAIVILQEEKTIPAGWDDDDFWPWRHVNIVPTFASYENNEYTWIDNLELEGFNPEKLYKDISEIRSSEISEEVEKIRKEIEKQYSGEIQILYR